MSVHSITKGEMRMSNKRKFYDVDSDHNMSTGSCSEVKGGQLCTPSTSSSDSSSSDDEAKQVAVVHKAATLDLNGHLSRLPYIHLDPEFTGPLCWSNDPGQLSLQTYFDPDKPNLASDFQVPGLCPILREKDGYDRFILTDDKSRFYVWDEWDGRLFWVRHKEIEELDSIEDKVEFVIGALGCLEVEPVYCTYHPADDPNVERIRNTFPEYRI